MANTLDAFGERRAPNTLDPLAPEPSSLSTPAETLPSIYGNEFTKGLRRGGLGMLGTTQAFGAQLLEPFAPKAAEAMFAEARTTLDFNKGLRPKVEKFDDVNDTGSFVDYGLSKVGEALPSTALSLGAAAVGGGAALGLRALGAKALSPMAVGTGAGVAAGFAPEAGETALNMQDDPAAMANSTPLGRVGMSALKGGVNAALEFVPERLALGRAFGAAPGKLGLRGAAGEVAKGTGQGVVTEGLTEGAQEFVGQRVHSLANPGRDTTGDLGDIKEAAIGGAFGGAGLGAVGGGVRGARGLVTPAEAAPVVEKPELPPGMDAGYKTAKFLDENSKRAADFIGRSFDTLSKSVDKKIRGNASVGWTDAKQKMLDDLVGEDSPARETLSKMSPEQQRAVVGAYDALSTSPKMFENRPELYEAMSDALGVDPAELTPFFESKTKARVAQKQIDDERTLELAKKMTPKERIESLQDLADPTEVTEATPAQVEAEDDDDVGGGTNEENGIDIKGKPEQLFAAQDKPITIDTIKKSLANRHFMRKRIENGYEDRPDVNLHARSDTLTPMEILDLVGVLDRDEDGKDVYRQHNDDEIDQHDKGDYATIPIRPSSLTNEVLQSPKKEDHFDSDAYEDAVVKYKQKTDAAAPKRENFADEEKYNAAVVKHERRVERFKPQPSNFTNEESFRNANETHYRGLSPLRPGQGVNDDSRKADLFMQAMGTVLGSEMEVVDRNGVTHKIKFDVERGGGLKGEDLPDNVVLSKMTKGGKGGYTTKKYASDKNAFTEKNREQLDAERAVMRRYKGAGNKQLSEAAAPFDKARREAKEAGDTDAYHVANVQFQALEGLRKMRTAIVIGKVKEKLLADGTYKTKEEIDQAATQTQYGVLGLIKDKEVMNQFWSEAGDEAYKSTLSRNKRATVMDSMKKIAGALEDSIFTELDPNYVVELIDDLDQYLEGEEPSPAVRQFAKEAGAELFTTKILNSPSMTAPKMKKDEGGEFIQTDEAKQSPVEFLQKKLAYLRGIAEDNMDQGTNVEASRDKPDPKRNIEARRFGVAEARAYWVLNGTVDEKGIIRTKEGHKYDEPITPEEQARRDAPKAKEEKPKPVKAEKVLTPAPREPSRIELTKNDPVKLDDVEGVPVVHTKAVTDDEKSVVTKTTVVSKSPLVTDDFGNKVRVGKDGVTPVAGKSREVPAPTPGRLREEKDLPAAPKADPRVEMATGHISRNTVRANPDTIYVFGDNTDRRGLGGQAASMRGEPNAVGVATKKHPSMSEGSFFTDAEFEQNKAIIDADFAKIPNDKKVVVLALGEGRAALKERAPKTYEYLQSKLKELLRDGAPTKPLAQANVAATNTTPITSAAEFLKALQAAMGGNNPNFDVALFRSLVDRLSGFPDKDLADAKAMADAADAIAAGKYNKGGIPQRTVDRWSKMYAGGTKVQIVQLPKGDPGIDNLFRMLTGGVANVGGAYLKYNGQHTILIPDTDAGNREITFLGRVAHEYGHALQRIAFDTATPEVQAEIRAAYEKDLEAHGQSPDVSRFVSTSRFGVPDSTAKEMANIVGSEPKEGRDQSVKDIASVLMGPGMANPKHAEYILSFEEWFAENFSKYVTSRDLSATMTPASEKFWQKLYDNVRAYYNEVIRRFQPNTTFASWVDSLAPPKKTKVTKAKAEAKKEDEAPPSEPPTPPPTEPPATGPTPPEPPDTPKIAQRLKDIVEKMFGKEVRIGIGEPEDAKAGENAWYVGRRQLDQYKANMAKLNAVRDKRREALREGKMAEVARLEELEDKLLKNTQILGLIYISPRLAEREHESHMYHEATHAAFDILLSPEERAILGTAFTKGTVARRLKEIYKDQPDVLKHMEDAEEAAAYGFQIFATAPEQLQLGAKVQTIFEKVAKFFRELAGLLTTEEKAEIIMNDVLSGRRLERGMTPLQQALEKDMTIPQKMQKLARTFGGLVKAGWDIIAESSYERMLAMDNPAFAKIAQAGYSKTGSEGDLGMVHAARAATNRYINYLDKEFKDFTQEEIKAGAEARIMGQVPTEARALAVYNALGKFFTMMHKYSTDAKVKIGFEKDYFPMGWDAEKVMGNREAFIAMVKKPEYEEYMSKLKVTPDELWKTISNYVTRGESFQDVLGAKTGEPVNQFAKDRKLSFIKPEDRRPFMTDDHIGTLIDYTKQTVRQAEYVRAYGNGGEHLDAWLKEAEKKYGATPQQLALAKDYVDGLLGDKGVGMSRAQKDLYGAMIVYQNFRLLPFNLFSSLVDPLGIAIRSNSISDAANTFMYNIKNVFRDLKNREGMTKDKWETLAQDWGVIEESGTMSNLNNLYNTLDTRGMARKLQDALFKYNLLNGWERNTKIMATKAAERFMVRAKEDFFGKDNERYLKELGLKKSDLLIKPDGSLALRAEEIESQGVSAEQALQIEKRLQDATVKFVNQSVLNPTAGDLPNWGSNPYFAPVFHLKQFMFTFQSTILRRIVDEAKMGNYKPMMASAIYVPGMIGADMMRGVLQNYGEEPPWKKEWGAVDYFLNGVDRSGLTGTGSLITGIKEDMMHGGSGFESLMGPSLEQLKKGVVAMESGSAAKVNFMVKAVPLNPIFAAPLLSSKGE